MFERKVDCLAGSPVTTNQYDILTTGLPESFGSPAPCNIIGIVRVPAMNPSGQGCTQSDIFFVLGNGSKIDFKSIFHSQASEICPAE